jgi:hypothetical protein
MFLSYDIQGQYKKNLFQAFLLALADLLIDLGVIMAPGRRRKRSNGG